MILIGDAARALGYAAAMIRTTLLAAALLATPALAAPDKALLAAATAEAPRVTPTLLPARSAKLFSASDLGANTA